MSYNGKIIAEYVVKIRPPILPGLKNKSVKKGKKIVIELEKIKKTLDKKNKKGVTLRNDTILQKNKT